MWAEEREELKQVHVQGQMIRERREQLRWGENQGIQMKMITRKTSIFDRIGYML